MTEEPISFSDWINEQDIELCHWDYVEDDQPDLWGNTGHHHELKLFSPDEVDVILERYLRNVRKIYGDPKSAGNQ